MSSRATAISSNGIIAGEAFDRAANAHQFVMNGSTMRALGFPLGKAWGPTHGVNKYGHMVGQASVSFDHVAGTVAWIWTAGTGFKTLPTLPGATFTAANGINDSEEIAGCVSVGAINHIVMWTGAHTIKDLGSGPTNEGACATAINAHGMMAIAYTAQGIALMGLYSNGHIQPVPLPSGGSLANCAGFYSAVTCNIGGINRYGDLVGTVVFDSGVPQPPNCCTPVE
jgi:hypothetical protein